MKISLIITTYNWKEALNAVLVNVKSQTLLPNEVIIADDGSKEDTANMIKDIAKAYPVPLIHSFQEDKGFRAAMSRNKAIAKASGDYIVMIDGDMIPSKNFIASHKKAARIGYFIQGGGRVLIDKKNSLNVIQNNILPSFFSKGISNRKNCINNSFLSYLFSHEQNDIKSTRSGNMGFWKDEYIEVNGFNENFIGWGREDDEFACRMFNANKKRFRLRFAATAYHLYHKENSRNMLKTNEDILKNTVTQKLTFCENGINKYL